MTSAWRKTWRVHRLLELPAGLALATTTLFLAAPVFASVGGWTARAAPPDVLDDAAVVALPNGSLMVAGGILSAGRNTAASTEVELYDPVLDQWRLGPSMRSARYSATTVVLGDGSVLLAGGFAALPTNRFEAAPAIATAVIFDPTTNTWQQLPPMPYAQAGATATLLADVTVLVAGGTDSNGILTGAAVYDPVHELWTSTSAMPSPRKGAAVVVLDGGRVLFAGGIGGPGQTLADAELFDPTTKRWTSAGTMHAARYSPAALKMPDGRVLMAGGGDGPAAVASAEFYDPRSNSWVETTSMPSAGQAHAFKLPSGNVLVLDSNGFDRTVRSALYDPGTESWTAGPDLRVGSPYPPYAVQLPTGTVVLLAGSTFATLGDVTAPPPNSSAIVAKTANSSSATGVLAASLAILLVVLAMLYWRSSVGRRGDST